MRGENPRERRASAEGGAYSVVIFQGQVPTCLLSN